MLVKIQKYRSSILFLVGVAVLIAGVVTSIFHNTAILPSTVILGTTLCGVGVAQTRDGKNGP